MQPLTLVGEVLSAVAARVSAGADASHSASGDGYKGWILTVASLLVVVAAGRVAGRLSRRSVPELTVLLNQSAAFYRRWPEHRHADAPATELMAEAARCQRIIQLLEAADPESGPAARGPIDGLHAWITLLHKHINPRDAAPSGPAYA
ncbi:hypothetical protein BH09ACT8_BH09ACT8_45280 [soil metagenome]